MEYLQANNFKERNHENIISCFEYEYTNNDTSALCYTVLYYLFILSVYFICFILFDFPLKSVADKRD